MSDEKLDLSALDPGVDELRAERIRQDIAGRAAAGLAARRRAQGSLWGQLSSFRVPVMAAGALVAAASLVVLLSIRPSSSVPQTSSARAARPQSLLEATGVPRSVAAWMDGPATSNTLLSEND
jgi:hypothetical protein